MERANQADAEAAMMVYSSQSYCTEPRLTHLVYPGEYKGWDRHQGENGEMPGTTKAREMTNMVPMAPKDRTVMAANVTVSESLLRQALSIFLSVCPHLRLQDLVLNSLRVDYTVLICSVAPNPSTQVPSHLAGLTFQLVFLPTIIQHSGPGRSALTEPIGRETWCRLTDSAAKSDMSAFSDFQYDFLRVTRQRLVPPQWREAGLAGGPARLGHGLERGAKCPRPNAPRQAPPSSMQVAWSLSFTTSFNEFLDEQVPSRKTLLKAFSQRWPGSTDQRTENVRNIGRPGVERARRQGVCFLPDGGQMDSHLGDVGFKLYTFST
ncbi:hypothetical protein RRG08_048450 [Elysia crispata]|uniref:Uncharacterized protein n=1 Tax=Elysia crispata TaxID=231223 RepID=A0AAE1B8W5_9GAST|nr:hypothetical protein RRG08_048450 [Elysia crispata]